MAITSTTIQNLVGATEKALGQTVDLLLKDQNSLVRSGLAVRSPLVDRMIAGGSRKAGVPFINPLATDVVNVSNDDINDDGDVIGMTAQEFMALRHDLNIGIGFTDLAAAVTRFDGKGGAAAFLADYWDNQYNSRAGSIIKGFLKTNAGLTYTSAAGADLYTAAMLAGATAGVHADEFDILIVNPAQYAQMRIDQKNAFVPASQTESRFDEWAGFKLLKSKAFGTDVVMARAGALAFGEGLPSPMIGTEYERLGNKGGGGGADILHSRRSVVLHPQGANYKGPIVPTVAQLEAAASWELAVSDIEQVGFRKIVLTPKA